MKKLGLFLYAPVRNVLFITKVLVNGISNFFLIEGHFNYVIKNTVNWINNFFIMIIVMIII